jgi:hypothetical protein
MPSFSGELHSCVIIYGSHSTTGMSAFQVANSQTKIHELVKAWLHGLSRTGDLRRLTSSSGKTRFLKPHEQVSSPFNCNWDFHCNLTCLLLLVYECRYVFGVTHVPRLEDWPVMPVEHIGFRLKVK